MIKTLTIVLNEETKEVDIKVCVSLMIEEEGICHILSFPFDDLIYKENESIFHVPLKLLKEEFDRLSSLYKNKTLSTQEKEERIEITKTLLKKRLEEDTEETIKYLAMTQAEKLIKAKNIGINMEMEDNQ